MNGSAAVYSIAFMVLAYLLGSIPTGYLLTRALGSGDIRKSGSGNIGATNVARVLGRIPGLLTLLADAGKGALPVILSRLILPPDLMQIQWIPALTILFAVLGHLFPIYLHFKGGKGVATAAGAYLALSPLLVAAPTAVFLSLSLITKRISAGSLGAVLILPVSVWFSLESAILTMGTSVVSLLIIWRHGANIGRLLKGTEPPFKFQ